MDVKKYDYHPLFGEAAEYYEPDVPALAVGRTLQVFRARRNKPWPYAPPTACAAYGRILHWASRCYPSLAREAAAFAASCWLNMPGDQGPTIAHELIGLSETIDLKPVRPSLLPKDDFTAFRCPYDHGPAWWPELSCLAVPLEPLDAERWLFGVPCVEHNGKILVFESTGISALSWVAAGLPISWRFVVASPTGKPRWGATPTEAVLQPTPPPQCDSILDEGRAIWRGKLHPATVWLKPSHIDITIRVPLYVRAFSADMAPANRTHICWGQALYGMHPDLPYLDCREPNPNWHKWWETMS